jgi:Ribosomal L18 C-terminal region
VSQVHQAIRDDPLPEKKERTKPAEPKVWKTPRLTYDERKERLKVGATGSLVDFLFLFLVLLVSFL